MEPGPHLSLADSIAAAQGWWREAGVDLAFHDEPRAWLAPPPETRERPAAPVTGKAPQAPPAIGGDRAGWPRDLAAFPAWWMEEPSLDSGPSRGRVPPRGPHAAPLMIVVPMPEAEDREALLSGPQGRLVANMIRAMGFAPDQIYLASALPRHAPMPDWPQLAADGMGEILRHHVGLVAPERLLVLGNDVLPFLGHDWAQAAPAVSDLSILSRKLPVLSSYAPGRLVDHPRLRAELWRRWLDWTGTEQ
ncbi:MAG: uracil-DNA glycosylase family protein [Croceibacterium sp.]